MQDLPVLARGGSHDALLGALRALQPKPGPQVMLVVGAVRRRPALAAVEAAARALADAGNDTLLVAADLRRPELRERFGLGLGAGLTDLLAVIERTGRPRIEPELFERTLNVVDRGGVAGGAALHVITTGPRPRAARTMAVGRPMRDLLDGLRGLAYSYVVVDGPAVLSRWVDTTVLVAPRPAASARDERALSATLDTIEWPPLGVIYPAGETSRNR